MEAIHLPISKESTPLPKPLGCHMLIFPQVDSHSLSLGDHVFPLATSDLFGSSFIQLKEVTSSNNLTSHPATILFSSSPTISASPLM